MSRVASISDAVVNAPHVSIFDQAPCTSVLECHAEIASAETSASNWHKHFMKRNGSREHLTPPSLPPSRVACATLEACRANWQAAQALQYKWRRAAGMLSCARLGIGPTGGFCESARASRTLSNERIAKGLAHGLGELFSGLSVLELGCGLGQYGEYFARNHSSVRWLGLDGAEGVEEATKGHVHFADLSEGIPPAVLRLNSWDWVLSLEVGEHVPTALEPMFMHNLITHARVGVVVSWAQPGQGGRQHVNCQPTSYVTCAIERLGMAADDKLAQQLRDRVVKAPKGSHLAAIEASWLRRNVLVFRTRDGAAPRRAPLTEEEYEQAVSGPCNRTKHYCY